MKPNFHKTLKKLYKTFKKFVEIKNYYFIKIL